MCIRKNMYILERSWDSQREQLPFILKKKKKKKKLNTGKKNEHDMAKFSEI